MKRAQGTDRRRRNTGAATLVITVVLLFVMSLFVVYTGHTVSVEKTVTANQQREMQAFNSAQAGIEYFVALLETDQIDTATGSVPQTAPTVPGNVTGTGCVAGDPLPQFTLAAVRQHQGVYALESLGFSDDCMGERMIRVSVAKGVTDLPNPLSYPLISRGNVTGGGAAHTIMNPESNLTIWTGADHDPANSHTLISNPSDPCDYSNPEILLQGCRPTGNNPGQLMNDQGISVIANDPNLSALTGDQFFVNFFGKSHEQLIADQNVESVTPEEFLAELAAPLEGGAYSVAGSLSLQGGTVGCSGSLQPNQECGRGDHQELTVTPSLVIVDGDLDIGGNPVAYGVVYVRGDLNVTGALRVFGSLLVEGQVKGNGSVDVYFTSGVLEEVSLGVPSATIIPGTWRDWRED
jgi:hypothetical protein